MQPTSNIHGQRSRTRRGRSRLAASLTALTVLGSAGIAGGTAVAAGTNAAAGKPLPASNYSVTHACDPASPGQATCFADVLKPTTAAARARTTPIGVKTRDAKLAGLAAEGAYGLRPGDLHSAYDLPTESSTSQTIALVDAYDDPTAEADLGVYDEEFGLPACTSANGCFTKLNEQGETSPLPEPEADWGLEISLDIETAHAVCQNCHIALVEANSSSFSDLEAAERTAVEHGATEVSNSYGGWDMPETGGYDYPDVVITASSGDSGNEEPGSYPSSSPNVVSVGGTTLGLEDGTRRSETAWSWGGSGCNPFAEAQPWQQAVSDWAAVGCGSDRAATDVSADADPNTGFAVYDSSWYSEEPVWLTVGGTSLSSPLISATFALAGGAGGVERPAETLYSHLGGEGLHDITEGSNGSCEGELICTAGPGYDGPTGVGTPNGLSAFIPIPKPKAPSVTSVSPSAGVTAGGTQVTITGKNLKGASEVDFGGSAATITADSATSITAVSPPHAVEDVDVVVTGSSGLKSPASEADRFSYIAPSPVLSSLSPNEGSVAGGTQVSVAGSNLDEVVEVDFGGVPAEIIDHSKTLLLVRAPEHDEPGTVDVVAESADGALSTVVPGDRFTYLASKPAPEPLEMSNVNWSPRSLRLGQDAKLRATLSAEATVVIAVRETVFGRFLGGHCVPGLRRGGHVCTTSVHKLTLRLRAAKGANLLGLALGHLRPGQYLASVIARANGETGSGSMQVSFTVRPKSKS
jgi:hypothetical protein